MIHERLERKLVVVAAVVAAVSGPRAAYKKTKHISALSRAFKRVLLLLIGAPDVVCMFMHACALPPPWLRPYGKRVLRLAGVKQRHGL